MTERSQLTGFKTDSADDAGYTASVVAYRRSGGNATILGSPAAIASNASGGFPGGLFAWDVAGSNLFLDVSGDVKWMPWSKLCHRLQ